MPRAPKYCTAPGCTNLTRERTCPEHTSRWPTDGRTQRTKDPLHAVWAAQVKAKALGRCQIRYAGICTGGYEQADHIVPVTEGGAPYDPFNGQGACVPCHKAKSSDEGHRAQGHDVPDRERLP